MELGRWVQFGQGGGWGWREARQLLFASQLGLAGLPAAGGCTPPSHGGLVSATGSPLPPRSVLEVAFVLVPRACGHRMAALLWLQVVNHRARMGPLCFAVTAASMATARDITGKVICRATQQEGGTQGWRELGQKPRGAFHASAPRGSTHTS